MRKLIVTAAAAALLASGSVAFAAVKHTTGTVKTYDGTAMSLVLDDGSTFTLPKTFKDPGLKAGEKVRVSWDMSGKNKVHGRSIIGFDRARGVLDRGKGDRTGREKGSGGCRYNELSHGKYSWKMRASVS